MSRLDAGYSRKTPGIVIRRPLAGFERGAASSAPPGSIVAPGCRWRGSSNPREPVESASLGTAALNGSPTAWSPMARQESAARARVKYSAI
jgi:hypothetical protein